MSQDFKTVKVTKSGVDLVDFDNIPFGKTFSDHMFVADYVDGQWGDYRIVPFENMSISPANMSFHYGQAVFEGMKASKQVDGTVCLFRPEMNAKRINLSARRLGMPAFPEDTFVNAAKKLVEVDEAWIPKTDGAALYIRPFMIAMDNALGVKASSTYRFIIFTGPVGPYYTKPLRLITELEYVRAVEGGVGEAKAAGNYAASLLPMEYVSQKGFDQIIWMDAHEFKYLQEAGTMNLFFVIDDTVLTPNTSGTILKGITRDSILHILKEKGLKVEERPISIDEVMEAHKNGKLQECFGAGTAAVIANVKAIQHKDTLMELPPIAEHKIATFLKEEINGLRSGKVADKYGWIQPITAPVTQ